MPADSSKHLHESENDVPTEDIWQSFFRESAAQRRQAQLERFRGGNARESEFSLDFGNNDYMGVSRTAKTIEALECLEQVGSTASPALMGYHSAHRKLEAKIAGWCGTEDALVFSSGYSANVGILSCLASAGDLILSDQLNHASLIDGSRLSKAQVQVFPHNDCAFVSDYLRQNRALFRRVLIVTESIFSMDGDEAPLVDLALLCDEFECGLVVDEAHATGAYGTTGCGLLEDLQLAQAPLLKLGTLSKSVGAGGGFAAGSRAAIHFLVNHCRSFIFSTALPIPIALAACSAIDQIQVAHQTRRKLIQNAGRLRASLTELGWNLVAGTSPIIPLIVGDENTCLEISAHLQRKGIYVPAIRPPTVPEGTARLRISLNATHSARDIEQLLEALAHFSPR